MNFFHISDIVATNSSISSRLSRTSSMSHELLLSDLFIELERYQIIAGDCEFNENRLLIFTQFRTNIDLTSARRPSQVTKSL